jgi:sterol desaturase/sphingolipid hydroxylase (fatty acid hydroxylase superfamily)
MPKDLDALNNMIPLVAFGSLAVIATLELWIPYFKHGPNRRRQRWRNIGLIIIGFLVNGVMGAAITFPIVWSETNNFGLLHRLMAQTPPAIVIGVLLLDLLAYVQHVTFHKVPALWRFHRVHHADAELDATSGLRIHPFELIVLLSWQAGGSALLGISMASTILYTVIALPWFFLNHSNMEFPSWFERAGRLVMATPNWHRVHHSSFQLETDSHYGCLFSIWDRLFGTTREAQVESIRFGLEKFRGPHDQTIWRLLKMPFANR